MGWPASAQLVDGSLAPKVFYSSEFTIEKWTSRISLVVQWLRIRLPMQGTRVRSLVQEDPTCRGATKPARHNY